MKQNTRTKKKLKCCWWQRMYNPCDLTIGKEYLVSPIDSTREKVLVHKNDKGKKEIVQSVYFLEPEITIAEIYLVIELNSIWNGVAKGTQCTAFSVENNGWNCIGIGFVPFVKGTIISSNGFKVGSLAIEKNSRVISKYPFFGPKYFTVACVHPNGFLVLKDSNSTYTKMYHPSNFTNERDFGIDPKKLKDTTKLKSYLLNYDKL